MIVRRLLALCLLGVSGIVMAADTVSASEARARTGKFRNTHYYVVLESLYADLPRIDAIRNLKGETLAMVSKEFRKAVDIEGTGRLIDGRIINFAGVITGTDGKREIRYLVTNAPFGLGVRRCQLVPFKTVAVDPRKIQLGSLVRIAETEGMKLPDGTIHDGYWFALDIGGAIKQDRIDLFVGDGDRGDVLRAHGIRHLAKLSVEIVSPPPPDSCVHTKRR